MALRDLSKVGQPVIGYPTSRELSRVFLHLNRHSDRRNIRTAEGWHFRLPAARSLPRSTLLSRKSLSSRRVWRERGKNTTEVWRRATFIRRAFRMVGSPVRDHITLPSKRALFASSRLPPSFFSLSVFEMKEFFLPNCAARQILERCNRKCYTIFLTGAIDILDSCDTLIFFSKHMDQAWLPYWTGSPDENPSFICLCVLPSFCLLMAFSLNIIALFLGCPGSRYCPTKYFMEQSTQYLPAISYSLSKMKGSSFGRGKREKVYFVVFIFKVSYMQQKHKGPGSLRGVGLGTRMATYLFIYLFIYSLFSRGMFLP